MRVVTADITTLEVDAIVNAANESLLGGGGVDGAIHRVAGPSLLDECRALGGCPTGQAKLTLGHGLPARFVVHTVGPVWRGGSHGEDELLADCYSNSLELARARELVSIAFPAIGTGAYRFPKARATRIAVEATRAALSKSPVLDVIFCCFSDADAQLYHAALDRA